MVYFNYIGHGVPTEYRRDKNSTRDDVEAIESGSGNFLGEVKATDVKQTDKTKTALIDGVVKVTTVSDKVRKEAQTYLSRRFRDSMITFSTTLLGSLVAVVGAVAAGVAAGMFCPPLWAVAGAAGLVALGILGFSIFNLVRGIQAKKQYNQWKDPLPAYQAERRRVGAEGFHYAFSTDKKGKYVSSIELKNLWHQAMDSYAARFKPDSKVDVSLIRDFMEKSILGSSALNYTFGDDDSLKPLSTQFDALKQQYNDIRRQTEAKVQQINAEKTRAHLQNDRERELLLMPYRQLIIAARRGPLEIQRASVAAQLSAARVPVGRSMHQQSRFRQVPGADGGRGNRTHEARRESEATAAANRTVTVAGHVVPGQGQVATPARLSSHVFPALPATATLAGHVIPEQRSDGRTAHPPVVVEGRAAPRRVVVVESNPIVIQLQAQLDSIDAQIARLNGIYAAMTAPIHALHASNARRIEAWADSEIKSIRKEEGDLMLSFYGPICALLSAYSKRKDESSSLGSLSDISVGLTSKPKAPELRRDFDPSSYDENWKEFVSGDEYHKVVAGKVDWDKGTSTIETHTKVGNNTETTTDTKQYIVAAESNNNSD